MIVIANYVFMKMQELSFNLTQITGGRYIFKYIAISLLCCIIDADKYYASVEILKLLALSRATIFFVVILCSGGIQLVFMCHIHVNV